MMQAKHILEKEFASLSTDKKYQYLKTTPKSNVELNFLNTDIEHDVLKVINHYVENNPNNPVYLLEFKSLLSQSDLVVKNSHKELYRFLFIDDEFEEINSFKLLPQVVSSWTVIPDNTYLIENLSGDHTTPTLVELISSNVSESDVIIDFAATYHYLEIIKSRTKDKELRKSISKTLFVLKSYSKEWEVILKGNGKNKISKAFAYQLPKKRSSLLSHNLKTLSKLKSKTIKVI